MNGEGSVGKRSCPNLRLVMPSAWMDWETTSLKQRSEQERLVLPIWRESEYYLLQHEETGFPRPQRSVCCRWPEHEVAFLCGSQWRGGRAGLMVLQMHNAIMTDNFVLWKRNHTINYSMLLRWKHSESYKDTVVGFIFVGCILLRYLRILYEHIIWYIYIYM
jgi:hypothetical protein